jgi:hypothetical protein
MASGQGRDQGHRDPRDRGIRGVGRDEAHHRAGGDCLGLVARGREGEGAGVADGDGADADGVDGDVDREQLVRRRVDMPGGAGEIGREGDRPRPMTSPAPGVPALAKPKS